MFKHITAFVVVLSIASIVASENQAKTIVTLDIADVCSDATIKAHEELLEQEREMTTFYRITNGKQDLGEGGLFQCPDKYSVADGPNGMIPQATISERNRQFGPYSRARSVSFIREDGKCTLAITSQDAVKDEPTARERRVRARGVINREGESYDIWWRLVVTKKRTCVVL